MDSTVLRKMEVVKAFLQLQTSIRVTKECISSIEAVKLLVGRNSGLIKTCQVHLSGVVQCTVEPR